MAKIKAVVLEHKAKKAVVFTEDGEFKMVELKLKQQPGAAVEITDWRDTLILAGGTFAVFLIMVAVYYLFILGR
ncbi:MAG: hypothetical protein ACM3QZ_07225 [Solirubrobacterales bacterium]